MWRTGVRGAVKVWVAGILCAVLAGCSETGDGPGRRTAQQPGGFSGRRLVGVTIADVRAEAARVFQQYYRLDETASGGDLLVSRPTELTEYNSTQRVRDVLGGPLRHRQLATLSLAQEGSDVLMQIQVLLQRLDTAERSAFASERGDDRPTGTPIERTGAASSERREEWVSVGRDRKLEQGILDQIQEHFSVTQPSP